MAKRAPSICPKCKKWNTVKPIAEGKGGFSGGKALAGGVLFGPVGLVAGALGKKRKTFQCTNCGYTIQK
jgi:hypothetical protein